jgi:ribose transport system ATP-binding protein
MHLELSGITKRFGPTVALDGVNLKLQDGEVHALIGENGAGKSTLMNIIAGSIQPDKGQMLVNGKPYLPLTPLDARRNGISLIHQELSLCPHLSVSENILMGMEPARFGWLDRNILRRKALEVLESFNHPEIHPDRYVGDLPIAAQQVVEICRAIAAQSNIILMDEPTSSLQKEDVERLFNLIKRLKNNGISVIYISHFLEEVREVADTYTVLRDGKSVITGPLSSVTNDELIAHMVGRSVENLFPQRDQIQIGEVLLEVENLHAPPAVQDVSFNLRSGEILGIAGLMGSGRTEMVRAIFGLDTIKSGTIRLKTGATIKLIESPAIRLSQGFGFLSEDRKGEGLALPLSLADNITLTKFSTCSNLGWLSLSRQRKQAERWIKEVNVKSQSASQPAYTLSGGNQQKVAIARLLHQDADVLLLDEPTRGIDIGSKAQVYEIIARCAAEQKAVLMVSSYLPELLGLCDRIAVMSRGRLIAPKPSHDWTPESIMQAAIGI